MDQQVFYSERAEQQDFFLGWIYNHVLSEQMCTLVPHPLKILYISGV